MGRRNATPILSTSQDQPSSQLEEVPLSSETILGQDPSDPEVIVESTLATPFGNSSTSLRNWYASSMRERDQHDAELGLASGGRTKNAPPWDRVGWGESYEFMQSVMVPDLAESAYTPWRPMDMGEVHRALRRRSIPFASGQPISRLVFRSVIDQVWRLLLDSANLRCGVVVQGIEGWQPASYILVDNPRGLDMRRRGDLSDLVMRSVQGQGFASTGGGCCLYFGMASAVCSDQDYASYLVSCGRAAQAVLMCAAQFEVDARMTPALHDSSCDEIFGSAHDIEMLHMLKLGFRSPGVGQFS